MLLLGVPVVVVLVFVVSAGWGAVADRYGRRVAADRAVEVEERARSARLTAADVRRGEVDELVVDGTRLRSTRAPDEGVGDAFVLLESTAWRGLHCIVLVAGADGDISSYIRPCPRR